LIHAAVQNDFIILHAVCLRAVAVLKNRGLRSAMKDWIHNNEICPRTSAKLQNAKHIIKDLCSIDQRRWLNTRHRAVRLPAITGNSIDMFTEFIGLIISRIVFSCDS
jgi:hypothetical protein